MLQVTLLDTATAKKLSEDANNSTYKAYQDLNISLETLNKMKVRIDEFLNLNHSTPEDIKKVAYEVCF